MKKYEYNDKTVNVPTNWGEVTVSTYDRMWNTKPINARERANVVAIACGCDLEVFLQWPREVFAMILQDVEFLFVDNPAAPASIVEVAGVKYVVAIEDRLTFAEFIDVDMVQKEAVYADAILSNVLAIVCRPAGEAYDPVNIPERVAMFGALSVAQVQPVLAFFLACYQVLTKSTALYAALRETVDQLPRNIALSQLIGDGIKLSRIWPTIRFYILMRSLRGQLRKFSHSYSISGIGAPQNTPKHA